MSWVVICRDEDGAWRLAKRETFNSRDAADYFASSIKADTESVYGDWLKLAGPTCGYVVTCLDNDGKRKLFWGRAMSRDIAQHYAGLIMPSSAPTLVFGEWPKSDEGEKKRGKA